MITDMSMLDMAVSKSQLGSKYEQSLHLSKVWSQIDDQICKVYYILTLKSASSRTFFVVTSNSTLLVLRTPGFVRSRSCRKTYITQAWPKKKGIIPEVILAEFKSIEAFVYFSEDTNKNVVIQSVNHKNWHQGIHLAEMMMK